MELRIENRIEQKFLLLPRQQLFLKLLTLPAIELKNFIEEKVEENPFLEREDTYYGEEISFIKEPESRPSFKENLIQQLHINVDSESLIKIGEIIIENLENDGYLRIPLEEIAENLKVSEEKVEEALEAVQNLEPAGIGARNLQECLLLQLRRKEGESSLAFQIVKQFWDELIKRKYSEISSKLKVSVEKIKEEIKKLKKLNPYPVSGIGENGNIFYPFPDGEVIQEGKGFKVVLKNDYIPSLRINSYYEKLLSEGRLGKNFMRKKFIEAKNLIQIIEERNKNLCRIFQEIVNHQTEFFKGGKLLPLKEKDIAEKTGLSVSTISRAISRKYLLTPRGLINVKKLFSSGVSSISSHYIKEKIREILREEKGLSDREISEKLKDYGIKISPRTVNKYRNKMGILSSYFRK
ncbi:MAG: RNA polymerase sigma-54 factor [Candidatus Omnitrophota bacterium]|nr:MAG: RNA polymerase sigma-54 factor [Candidatus Omnitrophota bacterium]